MRLTFLILRIKGTDNMTRQTHTPQKGLFYLVHFSLLQNMSFNNAVLCSIKFPFIYLQTKMTTTI